MEEDVKSNNIEIAVARTDTKRFEIYKKDKIEELIGKVLDASKAEANELM